MHHAARPPRVLNTIPAHLSVTLSVPGVLIQPTRRVARVVLLLWSCGGIVGS